MLVRAFRALTGFGDTTAKAIVAIVLMALGGVLVATFPGQPWVAPVDVALIGLAFLSDPNAGHNPASGG